jgi:hypothetical protein
VTVLFLLQDSSNFSLSKHERQKHSEIPDFAAKGKLIAFKINILPRQPKYATRTDGSGSWSMVKKERGGSELGHVTVFVSTKQSI